MNTPVSQELNSQTSIITFLSSKDANNGLRTRTLGANMMGVRTVCNLAGEKLGEIDCILFDISTGQIAYAVLLVVDFLRIRQRRFMVPWSELTSNSDAQAFRLNVSKEFLRRAPHFSKGQAPNRTEVSRVWNLATYYGSRPYWEYS